MALSKEEANTLREESGKPESKAVDTKPKSNKRVVLISAIIVFALILSGVGFIFSGSSFVFSFFIA